MAIMATITKPHARIYEVSKDHLEGSYINHVQAYRDGLDTLAVAIRTYGPIARKGISRNMLAVASLSKDDAIILRKALDEFIKESLSLTDIEA